MSAFSGLNNQAQENEPSSEGAENKGEIDTHRPAPIGVSLSLAAAVRAHKKGKMERAVQIYSDILRKYPDHADANYLLGVAAFDRGLKEDAVAMIERAIETDPQNPAYYGKLGEILTLMGLAERADGAYARAAELAPDDVRFHIGRAQLLEKNGDIDGALNQYRHIVENWPDSFEAHYRCAAIEARLGGRDRARAHLRDALKIKADYAEAHLLYGLLVMALGESKIARKHFLCASEYSKNRKDLQMKVASKLMQIGDFDGALVALRRETKIDPKSVAGFVLMGDCLARKGENDGAVLSYERALSLDNNHVVAYARRGLSLLALGQNQEALDSCQMAVQLDRKNWEANCALGVLLREEDNVYDALDYLDKAVALAPSEIRPALELARAHQDDLNLEKALDQVKQAQSLAPKDNDIEYLKSEILLQSGDWQTGWKAYESRKKQADYRVCLKEDEQGVPLWDGHPIDGKRIVLYCEQTYSDAILFVRFAPLVKALGASVYIACPKDLARLFAAVDGVDGVVPQGTPLPRHDFRAPLNSLPYLLGINDVLDLPSATAYLSAAPRDVDQWRQKLDRDAHGKTVGLVWQGDRTYRKDSRRSPGIWPFSRLFYMRNIDFFSLQVGDGADVLTDPQLSKVVRNYGIDLLDFADTAALIQGLDLVITCDSAVGHLAGAMGKECWMVLPHACDWRWGIPAAGEASKSLWYPSLSLYRQSAAGDWADVFARLGQELNRFVK